MKSELDKIMEKQLTNLKKEISEELTLNSCLNTWLNKVNETLQFYDKGHIINKETLNQTIIELAKNSNLNKITSICLQINNTKANWFFLPYNNYDTIIDIDKEFLLDLLYDI